MTTEPNRMSPDEVEAQAGSALPDKEAMSLLDVNANLDLALDLAAPVDAAIAANANVAAPIDASVAANVASVGSVAAASADQDSIIAQTLNGIAEANAEQTVDMDQSGG